MNHCEFRVGNLYSPTDGSWYHNMQVQAEDILAWSMGAIYGKPILVGKEVLLKLGFTKVKKKTYTKITRYGFNFSIVYDGVITTIGLGVYKKPNLILNQFIRNVHQLQNLYYDLTGEELKLLPWNT